MFFLLKNVQLAETPYIMNSKIIEDQLLIRGRLFEFKSLCQERGQGCPPGLSNFHRAPTSSKSTSDVSSATFGATMGDVGDVVVDDFLATDFFE